MRRLIGDLLALSLVSGWLLMTGAFIGAMKVANRIEGRK